MEDGKTRWNQIKKFLDEKGFETTVLTSTSNGEPVIIHESRGSFGDNFTVISMEIDRFGNKRGKVEVIDKRDWNSYKWNQLQNDIHDANRIYGDMKVPTTWKKILQLVDGHGFDTIDRSTVIAKNITFVKRDDFGVVRVTMRYWWKSRIYGRNAFNGSIQADHFHESFDRLADFYSFMKVLVNSTPDDRVINLCKQLHDRLVKSRSTMSYDGLRSKAAKLIEETDVMLQKAILDKEERNSAIGKVKHLARSIDLPTLGK